MANPDQGYQGSQLIYEPLPPQSFRLIKFDQNRFRDEHVVELRTFKIGQSPAYHALSYTWGPPLNTQECEDDYRSDSSRAVTVVMIRDGQPARKQELLVTRNLFECLCVLESRNYMWIDALCINQSDNVEKAIQVPLMGAIYTNARQVIVWLGLEESDLEGFKWIHEVLYPRLMDYIDANGQRAFDKVWHAVDFDVNLEVESAAMWDDYSRFKVQRRWFRRAWIVQEVCLASRISILAGRSEISWDAMRMLASFLTQVGSDGVLAPNTYRPRVVGEDCRVLDVLRLQLIYGGPNAIPQNRFTQALDVIAGGVPSDLHRWHAFFCYILNCTRSYEAQLPHDHVYSILGIMERYLPAGSHLTIIPNYELPFEEVYISTTFHLLRNMPNLSMLSCVEDKTVRNYHTLPSWVPDYSSEFTESIALETDQQWNACGLCSSPVDSRKLFGRVLELPGAHFDTIESISTPWKLAGGENALSERVDFAKEILMISSNPDAFPGGVAPRITSLAITLLAGKTEALLGDFHQGSPYDFLFSGGQAKTGVDVVFRAWLLWSLAACLSVERSSTTNCLAALENLKVMDPASAEFLFGEVEVMELHAIISGEGTARTPEQVELWETVAQHSNIFVKTLSRSSGDGHRIYRTSRGYIGVAPRSTEAGDQVWMLCDSRYPLLLRPTAEGGKCTLVGPSYLHGCMHGEMVTEEVKGRIGPVHLV